MPDLLSVFILEMLGSYLEGFIDALADGDAGDNDDEFTPSVALV